MRIATWNVNSLKARMPAVEKWLEKASPDVLMMQETKLANEQVPELPFQVAGYEVAHHGEGRWNGVAIASRVGISDLVTNFGDGPVRDSRERSGEAETEDDFNPFDEARMMSAVCGGVRFVSLYAPNGRVVGSPFYEGKLLWYERLHRWLVETRSPDEPLVVGGDLNATPADEDVWDPAAAHGGTHVSEPERAALARLREWGLVDALPPTRARRRPLLVVGLPGGDVPEEHGDADRPSLHDPPARRSGRSGPRSIAMLARVRRCRPTTHRCWSTSTNPALPSTPAGKPPCKGSPPAPSAEG